MSYQTPECLAPGNTVVPDVTCRGWKPTDMKIAPGQSVAGWLITAFDFDHIEYGRKATLMEWEEAVARHAPKPPP